MHKKSGILKGELKARGGKLIRCTLTVKNNIIQTIQITGDFFLHPEEKILDLEKLLTGCQLTEVHITSHLNQFFQDATVIGATPQDFLNLIMLTSKKVTT